MIYNSIIIEQEDESSNTQFSKTVPVDVINFVKQDTQDLVYFLDNDKTHQASPAKIFDSYEEIE
jgi:hypothetical protein